MRTRSRLLVSSVIVAAVVAAALWLRWPSAPERGGDSNQAAGSRREAILAARNPEVASRPADGSVKASPTRERAPTPASTKATNLEVTVRDAADQPIGDARVEVFAPPGGTVAAPRRVGPDGKARFELAAVDGYVVRASIPGTRLGMRGLDPRRVDIAMAAETVTVAFSLPRSRQEGIVFDGKTRRPVPGAVVRVLAAELNADDGGGSLRFWSMTRSTPERVLAVTNSDAEGRFVVEGTWRYAELEASTSDGRKSSGVSLAMELEQGGPRVLEVWVVSRERVDVQGSVRDEQDRPLAAVTVRLRESAAGVDAAASAVSDADGVFSLRAVAIGPYLLEVRLGDGTVISGPAWIEEGSALRLVVPTGTALVVTLLDDVSGAPIGGATVRARGWGGERGLFRPAPPTDASGHTEVFVPPKGTFTLDVAAAGYRRSSWIPPSTHGAALVVAEGDLTTPLRPGEKREIMLRLRRGAVVTGRVRFSDGAPAAGARVATDEDYPWGAYAATTTGNDGRFRLEGVLPAPQSTFGERSVRVVASLDGYVSAAATPRAVSGTGREAEEDLGDLVLSLAGGLRGRVQDPDGVGVAGAKLFVECAPADDGSLSDADGRFLIAVGARLPNGGERALAVSAPGFAAARIPLPDVPEPGSIRNLEPIVLRRAAARRVLVVDSSGRPVIGVRVLARNSYGDSDLRAAPTTGADGVASLDSADLDASFNLLTAAGARFTLTFPSEVAEGAVRRIRLPATRAFQGRVVDDSGGSLPGAWLALFDSTVDHAGEEARVGWPLGGAEDDGKFSFLAVPVGAFQLEVMANGCVTRIVDVSADARGPMEIILERFADKHRLRVAELQAAIRSLREQIDRDGAGPRGEGRSDLFQMERQVRRLIGER